MNKWTKYENEFIANSVTSDFLLDWIGSKGTIKTGHAEALEAAVKALSDEQAQLAFCALVTAIYVAFMEDKAEKRIQNLKDNSEEARKLRVAKYVEANGQTAVVKAIEHSEKDKKEFLQRIHVAA